MQRNKQEFLPESIERPGTFLGCQRSVAPSQTRFMSSALRLFACRQHLLWTDTETRWTRWTRQTRGPICLWSRRPPQDSCHSGETWRLSRCCVGVQRENMTITGADFREQEANAAWTSGFHTRTRGSYSSSRSRLCLGLLPSNNQPAWSLGSVVG